MSKAHRHLGKEIPLDARLDDFEFLETIGAGTFGRVRICRYKPNGRYYAVKVLLKDVLQRLRQIQHILQERTVLAHVHHPNVVNLVATFQDDTRLYMVLEYVPGGELFTHLRRMGHFSLHVAKYYAAQVVDALEYLHSKRVVYRDLKPENILLTRDGNIKITDFGFAKVVRDQTFTLCGTPEYLAPEVIQETGHSFGADWWSVGVLIYEMLAGFPPYFDDDPMRTYQKILEGNLSFPQSFNAPTRALLRGLLTNDKSRRLGCGTRLGAEEIKSHPFFDDIDWRAIRKGRCGPAPILPTVRDDRDTGNFDTFPEEDVRAEDLVDTRKPLDYTVEEMNVICAAFDMLTLKE